MTTILATLLAIAGWQQGQGAADRIRQAQYCAAVERRAQHREVSRAQAVSQLEPELAAAQHERDIERLVVPAMVGATVKTARLIHQVAPIYPPAALRLGFSGAVTVDAVIGTDGRVTKAAVANGDRAFGRVALRAVKQWRYEPALLDGRAIEEETVVTLRFAAGAK